MYGGQNGKFAPKEENDTNDLFLSLFLFPLGESSSLLSGLQKSKRGGEAKPTQPHANPLGIRLGFPPLPLPLAAAARRILLRRRRAAGVGAASWSDQLFLLLSGSDNQGISCTRMNSLPRLK
uniref:Uncharacterized protein n=1 Tax=Oryza barthii TaxID=65489 RepID=A0A0D3F1E0_9ORYZ